MTETSPEAAMAKARQLLDARVAAVRPLAEAYSTLTAARAAVSDAEQGVATAYRDAQKTGWTTDELKAVGFDAPPRRAPGRPRGSRGGRSTGATAPESKQPGDEGDQQQD